MTIRLIRLTQTALVTACLVLPAHAQTPEAKLDESLRESIERGCVGAQPVIIRTKPGFRQGLRDSLASHGDVVKGEFPALDAVAADVHCDDLATLAGFESTDSVSLNGPVAVQSIVGDAQADVSAARSVLLAAKADALTAQKTVRSLERAAALASAQVAAAQKALIVAKRLSWPGENSCCRGSRGKTGGSSYRFRRCPRRAGCGPCGPPRVFRRRRWTHRTSSWMRSRRCSKRNRRWQAASARAEQRKT